MDDLREPEFDQNALVILRNRYLIRDENDNILETPKELLWRVAVFVASADILYHEDVYSKNGGEEHYLHKQMFNPSFCEVVDIYELLQNDRLQSILHDHNVTVDTITALFRSWYHYQNCGRMKVNFDKMMLIYAREFEKSILPVAITFYEMMAELEFLPNTPTLMNSGMERSLLSGCFVLPIEDKLVSILDTCRDAALVHKAGGGTGFSFSRLRPRGDVVDGKPNGASGPVSFMKIFNTTTGEIKQGFSRRGANMGVLNVHHPDIREFIDCKIPPEGARYVKPDDVPFSNFNISVAVTDRFMDAVKTGNKYPLVNPKTNNVVDMINAQEIWKKIIHNAWENGDPGVIFIDEMNRYNPTPEIGLYESTNPCGEQVLLPNESCNLGAINLNMMMTDGYIDYEKLNGTIRGCIRFLNNVIDMNRFPLKEIEDLTRGNRKVGLGLMGFADVLYRMSIPYDSIEGVDTAKTIANYLKEVAWDESFRLSEMRGPFPNVNKSVFKEGKQPFNAALTTIAPTGTTGIIANSVSGGIEPITYLKYSRRTFEGDVLTVINPIFLEFMRDHELDDKRVMDHVHAHGSISSIQPPDIFDGDKVQIFGEAQKIFKVAHDISYKAHIRMQSAFQEFIDSSISKTINFPENATEDDVKNAFIMAHEMKCKGITIYRDGSKDWQVITSSGKKKNGYINNFEPMKVPDTLPGNRYRVETGCGSIYVMIYYDEDTKKPLEVFIEMGKSGGCAYAWAHGIGRLVSIQLRYGLPVSEIIKQLKNVQCPHPLSSAVNKKKERISSCVDAIAIALQDYLSGLKDNSKVKIRDRETRRECPKCGSGGLINTEGCVKCQSCDWSKCE